MSTPSDPLLTQRLDHRLTPPLSTRALRLSVHHLPLALNVPLKEVQATLAGKIPSLGGGLRSGEGLDSNRRTVLSRRFTSHPWTSAISFSNPVFSTQYHPRGLLSPSSGAHGGLQRPRGTPARSRQYPDLGGQCAMPLRGICTRPRHPSKSAGEYCHCSPH